MPITRTLTTRLGHQITAFCNDHVGDKIALHGLYEPENIELIIDLIGKIKDPVVLDIGANIGNHSLAFATRAASVHAFEPIPAIYRLLQDNAAANGLTHVHTHPLALSDTAGISTIYMVKQGNFGASSFDQRAEGVEPIEVRKHTGDEFVRQQGLGRIDFIKIDVEAHEVFVLRGLMRTLERDLPWLTMEWNDKLTIDRLLADPRWADNGMGTGSMCSRRIRTLSTPRSTTPARSAGGSTSPSSTASRST
jgi:FkbM family methyltransferase